MEASGRRRALASTGEQAVALNGGRRPNGASRAGFCGRGQPPAAAGSASAARNAAESCENV